MTQEELIKNLNSQAEESHLIFKRVVQIMPVFIIGFAIFMYYSIPESPWLGFFIVLIAGGAGYCFAVWFFYDRYKKIKKDMDNPTILSTQTHIKKIIKSSSIDNYIDDYSTIILANKIKFYINPESVKRLKKNDSVIAKYFQASNKVFKLEDLGGKTLINLKDIIR